MAAPAAVLAHLDPVRRVPPRLVGLVIAPLAVFASQRHRNADISASHRSPRCERVVTEENPGPRREAGLENSAPEPAGIPRALRHPPPPRGENSRPGRLSDPMRNEPAPDRVVAAIAEAQHGAISIDQLRRSGLSRAAVTRRVQAGRLHKLHRGVYAVGHVAPSNRRRWIAAVLALSPGGGGPPAVLSHRSAASLWQLLPPAEGPIDVSLPGRGGRQRRRGIRIHRPVSLKPNEMTSKQKIPVTSPARTLQDLRAAISNHELRRAIRQADFLHLGIGDQIESDGTRSELERSFLRLCRRYELPEPSVNTRVGPLTVDFCWARARLIVETDGYRFHRGRAAFEDDRDRDLILSGFGYAVQHLSYRQVVHESARVAAVLRAKLKRVGAPL